MLVPKNTNITFTANFGSSRDSNTVSYRILNYDLSVHTNWTTDNVVEIGFGLYGVSLNISAEMRGFVQWKAVEGGKSDLYTISAITVVDDFISNISNIFKVETGRWKIISNQMIFYDTDDTTPIYTFNLKDSSGNLTSTNPVERTPV